LAVVLKFRRHFLVSTDIGRPLGAMPTTLSSVFGVSQTCLYVSPGDGVRNFSFKHTFPNIKSLITQYQYYHSTALRKYIVRLESIDYLPNECMLTI
jgi:hypothetical protein